MTITSGNGLLARRAAPALLVALGGVFSFASAAAMDPVGALREGGVALFVGAHPDDETACGGLLARAADLCDALYLASATRGENSDLLWNGLCRGSDVGRARAELFQDAAAILGAAGADLGPFVNGPHSLDELDRQCPPGAPFQPWPPQTSPADVERKWSEDAGEDAALWFVRLIRTRKPDVLVSYDGWCGVSGHPEHLAVARLLERAVPLAAAGAFRPDLGPPHRVRHWILVARLAPPLRACGLCKCQGTPPAEPIEQVFTLDRSPALGVTYFRVACRVAKHYENVMLQQGLSRPALEALCASAEKAALAAWAGGSRIWPILEPYRVVRWR